MHDIFNNPGSFYESSENPPHPSGDDPVDPVENPPTDIFAHYVPGNLFTRQKKSPPSSSSLEHNQERKSPRMQGIEAPTPQSQDGPSVLQHTSHPPRKKPNGKLEWDEHMRQTELEKQQCPSFYSDNARATQNGMTSFDSIFDDNPEMSGHGHGSRTGYGKTRDAAATGTRARNGEATALTMHFITACIMVSQNTHEEARRSFNDGRFTNGSGRADTRGIPVEASGIPVDANMDSGSRNGQQYYSVTGDGQHCYSANAGGEVPYCADASPKHSELQLPDRANAGTTGSVTGSPADAGVTTSGLRSCLERAPYVSKENLINASGNGCFANDLEPCGNSQDDKRR